MLKSNDHGSSPLTAVLQFGQLFIPRCPCALSCICRMLLCNNCILAENFPEKLEWGLSEQVYPEVNDKDYVIYLFICSIVVMFHSNIGS